MAKWEEIRHQVSIAGKVTDAWTGSAIAGAHVEITSAPQAFMDWLTERAKQFCDKWSKMAKRPDRILTRADGHFHFLDIPDGQYTLTARLPGSGTRYGTAAETVTVAHGPGGSIIMAQADIKLPPTLLKGKITDMDTSDAVILAEVRIQGGTDKTLSDGNGQYVLAGIEAGQRSVLISAQGYQQALSVVQFNQAGEEVNLDFVVQPETP